MELKNINVLKSLIIDGLYDVAKDRKQTIRQEFLDDGVNEVINTLSKLKSPEDLGNFILFPIPEKLNNAVMGSLVWSVTTESYIRSSIVQSIENHLKNSGIHIDSISQKIEKLYDIGKS